MSGHLSSSDADGYWARDLWLAQCLNGDRKGLFFSPRWRGSEKQVSLSLALSASDRSLTTGRLSNSEVQVTASRSAFYYFLLFSTVFNVVSDWKLLATAGMKCQSKLNSFNGIGA